MKKCNSKIIMAIGLIGLLFVSCKEEQKQEPTPDYAIVKGNIENAKEGLNLKLYDPKTSENIRIEVKEDGSYLDTLEMEKPASFNASYGNIFNLYLKNGMDLEIDFDAENLSKSLSFKGNGAAENKYIQYKNKKVSNLFGQDYRAFLSLEEEEFKKEKKEISNTLKSRLEADNKKLDTAFIASEKGKIEEFLSSLDAQRQQQMEINEKVGKGKMSPLFKDYKNYKGGTSSLKDYRGSYVYIDVWATWCVPCLYEIPYLKELEEEYKNDNIKFISLSIDKPKDEDKWRKMIEDKELHGIQLLADNALQSQFVQDYFIQGIPRFILLDPDGKIVSYDAPRPSYPELKDMFAELDM